MLSDRTFKISLFISVCIHIALLYPWSLWLRSDRQEISFSKIELTYLKEGQIRAVMVREIRPITSLSQNRKGPSGKAPKTETLTIEADVPSIKKEEKDIAPKQKASSVVTQKTEDAALREGIEYEDALTAYCLTVRQKIQENLERNGKGFTKKGDVYVRIVINNDGSMKDISLYKTSGRNIRHLERIAIRAIKESFPFPPFDAKVSRQELALKIPIRFTP